MNTLNYIGCKKTLSPLIIKAIKDEIGENNLKEMNSIGYIDQSYLTDINIYKTNLVKQKNFNTKNQTEDLAKKIINHIQ